VPILSIGETVTAVGAGDLELRSTIAKRDELGKLSSNINEMIEGLEEKNRLEVENSVIEARNDENRKYLDNISEGLLLGERFQKVGRRGIMRPNGEFGGNLSETARYTRKCGSVTCLRLQIPTKSYLPVSFGLQSRSCSYFQRFRYR